MNTIDRLDPVCWVPIARAPSSAPMARRGWLNRQWQRFSASALRTRPGDELAELDAHTLADIGAPDHLLDRAMARREVQRQEREGLRIGLAAGAWHHW